jgi:hypothetical protein
MNPRGLGWMDHQALLHGGGGRWLVAALYSTKLDAAGSTFDGGGGTRRCTRAAANSSRWSTCLALALASSHTS